MKIVPISLKKHFVSWENNILFLRGKGKNNSIIISILILETYFRPLDFRIIEILAWLITDNKDMTLGLSQLKVSTWNNMPSFNNKNIIRRIIALSSCETNYDAIYYYLVKNKVDLNNIDSVAFFYNGKDCRKSYIYFLMFLVNETKKIVEKN